MFSIHKVGIVGAGTMGSGIAAHLANSGIPVVLLDIPTPDLPPEEAHSREARNRLVQSLYDRMAHGRPVQLGRPERGRLITLGNTEDDFDLLADCDWVIEVIIERLAPKQALMTRLEETCKPGAIISSNTSGIPISQIAAGRSPVFKKRFLGTHFFNPPRYLKLLEIIPTNDTDPAVTKFIGDFGQNVLGKGIVLCKDTPNFIANRFGAVTGGYTAERALSAGLSVAEVDELVGPLLGRPRTGYFRLADLVGLDIRTSVLSNLYPLIPHDPHRRWLRAEKSWAVYEQMLANGWLGNKAGQGFYKKTMVDGRREFWTLDVETLDYSLPQPRVFPGVAAAAKIRPLGERLGKLFDGDDEGCRYVRDVLYFTLAYAAHTAPEIAFNLHDIDNAVRWGFNHQAGPFEIWDMLGVEVTAKKMTTAGFDVPEWVAQMLASGRASFYENGTVYDFSDGSSHTRPQDPRHLTVAAVRRQRPQLAGNESASLHELGDQVLLLEFHTKANAIDTDIFAMGYEALERLGGPYRALVIGNDGRHFSVGANLGKAAAGQDQQAQWEATKARIRAGQEFMMALRHAPKPVVAALHGRALGGGAEFAMHTWTAAAAHEFMIGLVEVNVGLVPAWGGCKETLRRKVNPAAQAGDPSAALQAAFQQLMMARVSGSAWEAKSLGYVDEEAKIVMNPDHRLAVAKEMVLNLWKTGTPPPENEQIYAAGAVGFELLLNQLETGSWERPLSDYDKEIGRHLARILTGGGEDAPAGWVDPWVILDLEREASLTIRINEKTLARIEHMLKTGKPLRN